MCDVATPATILATPLPFRLAAVTFDRAPALEHHLGVLFLGRARHHGLDLLERQPVSRRELGGEVDVATEPEHAVPVTLKYYLLLLLGHRPLVEIGALVRLERSAVLGLHHGHAEHVEVIALARAIRVEHDGSRQIV